MNIVIAGNHDEFEQFLHDNYIYVGDKATLESIDPAGIDQIYLVGSYDQHPFYWSDDLLRFQINMSIAKFGVKVNKEPIKPRLRDVVKGWFK